MREWTDLPGSAKLYVLFSSLVGFIEGLSGAYLVIVVYNSVGPYGLGFSLLAYHLVVVLTDYPTGAIADSFGRKKTYSLGLMLEGVALILLSMAKSIPQAVVASSLSGIGVSLMSGSLAAWVVDNIKAQVTNGFQETLAAAFSLARGFATIARILSGFVAAYLATYGIWIPVFISGIMLMLVSMLLAAVGNENYGALRRMPLKQWLKP